MCTLTPTPLSVRYSYQREPEAPRVLRYGMNVLGQKTSYFWVYQTNFDRKSSARTKPLSRPSRTNMYTNLSPSSTSAAHLLASFVRTGLMNATTGTADITAEGRSQAQPPRRPTSPSAMGRPPWSPNPSRYERPEWPRDIVGYAWDPRQGATANLA